MNSNSINDTKEKYQLNPELILRSVIVFQLGLFSTEQALPDGKIFVYKN